MNVLFVCSRNEWRSPTAEKVWERTPHLQVRSAGTSRTARRRLSAKDIRWADLILVMEHEHKTRMTSDYRDELRHKPLHVLGIPDEFRFMDPELIEMLRDACAPLLLDDDEPTI